MKHCPHCTFTCAMGAGMSHHFKSKHPGEKYVGKSRVGRDAVPGKTGGGKRLTAPVTPAAAALCKITCGDFVYDFDFATLGDLDAGIIAFKLNVEQATKLAPLAALVVGRALAPRAPLPEPIAIGRRGAPALPKTGASTVCPKCDKNFKRAGKPYEKHIAACGATKAKGIGQIAVIGLKHADVAAVHDEANIGGVIFNDGLEVDATKLTNCRLAIILRHHEQWITAAENMLGKTGVRVVIGVDEVIAQLKKHNP